MLKRTVSLWLALVILAGVICCAPLSAAGAESADEGDEGLTICFGRYYQSEVTDTAELDDLRSIDFGDDGRAVYAGNRYIRKGSYYDYHYYRFEPIEWQVIGHEDGGYVLMSKKVLDVRQFNGGEGFWSECGLRDWLNNEFLNEAFSKEERENILLSDVTNIESNYDNSPGGGKPFVRETKDYVYLLDKDEMEYLFANEIDRIAYATEYANNGKETRYWLRGPKSWVYGITRAYYVNPDGTIGDWYPTYSYGVRPVIKVKSTAASYIVDGSIAPGLFCDFVRISGIDVHISKDWFFKSSASYDHNIATLCSQMLLEGYIAEDNKMNGVEADLYNMLYSLGFLNIQKNLDSGRDEMNHFIASKTIKKNGESYHLIVVGCVGSWHEQWNSNFDPYGQDRKNIYADTASLKDVNHLGFNDAKNYIYQRLSAYLNHNGYTKSNTKIVLTGHSRGGATANLLAAKLIDEETLVSRENLFAYTFASPNCTRNKSRSNTRYSRIYNVVYPCDFVTKVLPAAWGYGRYGTTYTLPAKTNEGKLYVLHKNRMLDYYNPLNKATAGNTKLHDYLLGEAEVRAVVTVFDACVWNLASYYHVPHTCGSKLITPFQYFQSAICPMVNETTTKYGGKAKAYEVMLTALLDPNTSTLYKTLTEFFVLNQGISPKFEDAHKMETYCAYMMALTSDELTTPRKGFLGSVNCPVDVEIIDKESGKVVARIVNNTVDEQLLSQDDAVVVTVDGDEKQFWLPSGGSYQVRLTGNDDGVMDYTLSEMNPDTGETSRKNYLDVPVSAGEAYSCTGSNGSSYQLKDSSGRTVAPDSSFTAGKKVEYHVEVTVEGSGSADSVTVTDGDYATLSASPFKSSFIGWYQNKKRVSKDPNYRFRPTEDTTLTARFTQGDFMLGDVDLDDTVTILDATAIQRSLANVPMLYVVRDEVADADEDGSMTIIDATYLQRWLASLPSNEHIGKSLA